MKFKNIVDSDLKCRLGKNKSYECTKFQSRSGDELITVEKEIQTRLDIPSRGKCFWISVILNPLNWAGYHELLRKRDKYFDVTLF